MVVGTKIPIKDPQKNLKVEKLKILGTTTFVGTTNPFDAKIWMEMLEKCLDEIGCPEDRKVWLATLLLQGGASEWWKLVRSKQSGSEITNWGEFKKAFYEEYYIRSETEMARWSEFNNQCTISTSKGKQFSDDTEFVPEVARHATSKPKFCEKSSSKTDSSSMKKQVIGSPISIIGLRTEGQESSTFSHDQYNYGQSSHMKREYPLLMPRGNVLEGSFSQPEQLNVQVGQGQYMVPARSMMKGGEGDLSNEGSSRVPKSKGQVGTPRSHGKVFSRTQR